MDNALAEILSSYVPPLVSRYLTANAESTKSPSADAFPAAVLLADITGFTLLADRFAQRGPAGVETLSTLLNTYFSQLIALISAHGGEVVKFAGDALLALWPAESETSLAEMTKVAASCGLVVQELLHNTAVTPDVTLSLRIAISAGEVWTVHVGGILGRWEFTFVGEPLLHVAQAQPKADPGDVVLSQAAVMLAQDEFFGEILADGDFWLQYIADPPVPPLPVSSDLKDTAETALKAYIPGAIIARLAAGQTGWLAELRQVTVLFINLPDFNRIGPGMLEKAQIIMRTLQTVVYKYEGSINKLSVDDKGVNLVAAQGLPPMAHEDNVLRGIQMAIDLKQELEMLGIRLAIGVATGHAFCGLVGSKERREYTMIGSVVNLAARLMEASPGDLFCDDATYQVAKEHFVFESKQEIVVKGRDKPIPAYRPSGEMRQTNRPQTAMVGRASERLLLIDRMQTLLRGNSSVVIVEGEAGIGKSRLLEKALADAPPLNIFAYTGSGNAIERLTPYFAWRPIFNQIFGLEEVDQTPGARLAQVQEILLPFPDLPRLLPLLNAVLPLDMEDNEVTGQMGGQVRADNTQRLLVRLLQETAESGPIMLVIDDAHWLDSASWALLRQVKRAVTPVMIVLAIRPFTGQRPPEYDQLLESAHARLIRLDALPPGESLDLVCQRLGVTSLPEPVADFICERAEGHPFFSEEMAYALCEAGLLLVEGEQSHLAVGVNDLQALKFPDTVQGVVTSRIDRLEPEQLLTLKVASVIGRVFEYNTLHHAYPIETDKPQLQDYLRHLENLRITLLEATEPTLAYIFKHIITQEVTYNLMLYSQRQQLHSSVAEWYEIAHTDELTPYLTTLAYHWQRAGELAKAIDYIEKAAGQVMRDGAFQEAIDLLGEAISMVEGLDNDRMGMHGIKGEELFDFFGKLRRARWERQLGQAYFGLGKLTDSREHLQASLALLGYKIPEGNGRLLPSLMVQWGGVVGRRFLVGKAKHTERLLEAATAFETLGHVHFYLNESLTVIYTAFRTLNLAERAGESPQLAHAYANMGMVLGLVPLHRYVERYNQRALAVAEEIDQLPVLAYVRLLSGIYESGLGQWERAQTVLEKVLSIARHLGDQLRQGEALNTLGLLSYYQGRLDQGVEQFDAVYMLAHQSENLLHQAWAFSGKSGILLRMGRSAEAVELAQSALELLQQTADLSEEIRCHVTVAVGKLRLGDEEGALAAVETAVSLMRESISSPTAFFTLDAYAGIAEVSLTLWGSGQSSLKRLARGAVKGLQRFARVFPIGRVPAHFYQGVWAWENGRSRKAVHIWQQCIEQAQKMKMPFEEALAHWYLGRYTDDVDAEKHAAEAQKMFAAFGVEDQRFSIEN